MFASYPDDIQTALERVGALLALESVEFAVVIVGGAALNLRGLVVRATSDVDIIAFADATAINRSPATSRLSAPPEPLPRAYFARHVKSPETWDWTKIG